MPDSWSNKLRHKVLSAPRGAFSGHAQFVVHVRTYKRGLVYEVDQRLEGKGSGWILTALASWYSDSDFISDLSSARLHIIWGASRGECLAGHELSAR